MGIALENKLLTIPEAVELFPVPISPATLYRWSREGRLRSRRIGAKVFIPAGAVEEFLNSDENHGQTTH